MVTAVVTGAAGFLGSHLVDALLAQGESVVGIDNLSTGSLRNLTAALANPSFTFRKVDLTRVVRLPRAECYYHFASPASPPAYQRDPIGTLRVNAEGTLRVLEAARKSDATVLVASTSEVYGDPEVHPQIEAYWGHVNPIGLRSCYDEGKRYGEALSMAFRRQYSVDVRIARIFNTYGPRMDAYDGRVISNFLVQALDGKPLTLYGRGSQTRSFCYVSDLIDGLLRLMRAAKDVPTPMNLGNPSEVSVLRLAKMVAQIVGSPLRVRYLPLPEDDPAHRRPDIRRALRYLNWAPRIPLEKGLKRTSAYFASLHRPGVVDI